MASSTAMFLLASLAWIGAQDIRPIGAASPPPSSYSTGLVNVNMDANTDFSSLSVLCRNSQDVLSQSNLSAYAGDLSCISSASNCASQGVASCTQTRAADPSFIAAARRCTGSGQTPIEVGACVLPTVLKTCDLSGCSSCSSSFNAPFAENCTAGGGQLCRQTTVVFGHRILSASVCAPSVCSSKLLATSIAEFYSGIISRSLANNKVIDKPEFIDSEVTCGSTGQSYTIRSSEATPRPSGGRSSQTASLQVVVIPLTLAVILRFF